jgi:hypothetical protein
MSKQYSAPADQKLDANKSYTATIETTEGTITAELYPKIAPKTVNAFVFLAREGYYEGVIFHRVIPGFMIQGGDPTGTGTGGPGYRLPAEFNDIKHERGVLSMARTNDPNSAVHRVRQSDQRAGSRRQDRQRPQRRARPAKQAGIDQENHGQRKVEH